MPKRKFNTLVKNETYKKTFDFLMKEKNKQKKMAKCNFSSLKMEPYLLPKVDLDKTERIFMYLARTENLSLRCNFKFKEKDIKCPKHGCPEEDTQSHLFFSSCYQSDDTTDTQYHHIFSDDTTLATSAMRKPKMNFTIREEELSSQSRGALRIGQSADCQDPGTRV